MLPFVPNQRKNMVRLAGRSVGCTQLRQGGHHRLLQGQQHLRPQPGGSSGSIRTPRSRSRRPLEHERLNGHHGQPAVVPIASSLLYVQPLYLQAEQTPVPQLKEVVVFYQSPEIGGSQVVAMKPTLRDALIQIFGAAPAIGPSSRRPAAPRREPRRRPEPRPHPTPRPPATPGGTKLPRRCERSSRRPTLSSRRRRRHCRPATSPSTGAASPPSRLH